MDKLPDRIIRYDQPSPPARVDLNWARVEEYLDSKNRPTNTRRSYATALRQFADYMGVAWAEVTPRMVTQYRKHLRELGRSPATINLRLSPVSGFYKWLGKVYADLGAKNPCEGLGEEQVPEALAQDLNPEQVAALWEVAWQGSLRDRVILALLSHGLRRSEVCGLRIGDFSGDSVTIRQAKAGSIGVVPLSPIAAKLVSEIIEGRDLGEPIVFSQAHRNQGQPLSPDSVWAIVRNMGDLAGLPGLRPHQLRHTFATQAVLAGLDPAHIQELTRHKNAKTLARYTKRGRQVAAANAFRAQVGEILPSLS
jgi:integrase/recombinase XerD